MINARKKTSRISTIDQNEISHFSAHAADWWALQGTYAPLHKMTPARMAFIKKALGDLKGQSILDIGCGGGLVCEPMARLGAKVTGADADACAIDIAKTHAQDQNLQINYFCGAAEDLAEKGLKFDAITALEILEHVSRPSHFIDLCASLLKPNGRVIFSTLNRTWKSYGLGIIVAERVLNWAPAGTHEWGKFIKPSELARMIEASGLQLTTASGLVYQPLHGKFALAPHDLDVNYFMVATKAK
ncbi:MAG: bifunctional 2-polyprenyl-6-hydroxyphenol methylase/3-demethylubiquinol 3-O-methyltransferase UbiG [Micavibrio sp.]|nr:bifunctional 2-polyprenyl-6-hydroxyphenol methylase/3-demethylubiquinol 3-O-methyltransferase UbiG [Micavibrio sp.]